MELVFASHNAGKIKEIRELFAPLGITILSAEDLSLGEVEETGTTFEENAMLKALFVAKESGLPAFADDSGLCIHALGDEPGLYSARYAKKCGGYPQAFEEIHKRLANKEDKTAHYACALVLAFPNGKTKTYSGRIDGQIVPAQYGESGFGYDPIFMPDGYTQTFSTMGENTKNHISHRAQAVNAFMDDLKNQI